MTPDFIAQSSRRGEVEVKAVAGSSHWALVIPYGEDGRPVATGSRTISCSTSPAASNLHILVPHTPSTSKPLPPPRPRPGPHLRSSSSPCASWSCRCRRCGSLPTRSDSPLCRGARSGPALCASSGSPGGSGGKGGLDSARDLSCYSLDGVQGWGRGRCFYCYQTQVPLFSAQKPIIERREASVSRKESCFNQKSRQSGEKVNSYPETNSEDSAQP